MTTDAKDLKPGQWFRRADQPEAQWRRLATHPTRSSGSVVLSYTTHDEPAHGWPHVRVADEDDQYYVWGP